MQNNAGLFLFAAAASLAMLIVPAIIWKVRFRGKMLPVLVGAITFFLFVNVLEGTVHMVCLIKDNGISRFLNSNAVAYALYGAFMAGIFEETGRFLAFKTVLRKHIDRTTAISYGIGHGGIEAVLTVGANYMVLAIAALSVGTAAESQYASLLPVLGTITPGLCAIALTERFFAIVFHISASVFVLIAARDRKRLWYYPLAILLHAVLDIPAGLYQSGILSLAGVEVLVAVYAVCLAIVAVRLYKREGRNEQPAPVFFAEGESANSEERLTASE